MSDSIITEAGGVELLCRLEPLWEALKAHHERTSTHFGDELAGRRFAGRRAELEGKASGLRVEIAFDRERNCDVGYCVSTVDGEGKGEIDSLYVDDGCRGEGLGRRLAQSAIRWMKERGAEEIQLLVVAGNDAAIHFYERLGFYSRNVHMVRK